MRGEERREKEPMKTKFSTCASRAHLQHHIRCIGLKSPIPITLQTTSWLLGITYPQSIKRLGHLLAADCKSAGTPNGGKGISDATKLP